MFWKYLSQSQSIVGNGLLHKTLKSFEKGDLREPEVLSAPMEMIEEAERAKIYAERTRRVREYCKYMPNDTMIDEWKEGSDVSNADFPMVVDPIHKILYCELPKVGSSNWKRVLIKLTDPRYEDVKNVLGEFFISEVIDFYSSEVHNIFV